MAGFAYQRPQSLAELVALVSDLPADSYRFIAGGTDLLPQIHQKTCQPETLISLRGLNELSGISCDGNILKIGAGTTLREVQESPLVREHAFALAMAAKQVASPQIRNMGTIGGNICLETRCLYYNQLNWPGGFGPCLKRGGSECYQARKGKRCFALCRADTPAALMVLDAGLNLVGPGGDRTVPVGDFYTDDGYANRLLGLGEVVASITIPIRKRLCFYTRLSLRQAIDFPVIGVAAGWDEGRAEFVDLRIAATGLISQPLRLVGLEKLLENKQASFVLGQDFEPAVAKIPVFHHVDAPAGYRKKILTGLLRTTLAMVGEARGGL